VAPEDLWTMKTVGNFQRQAYDTSPTVQQLQVLLPGGIPTGGRQGQCDSAGHGVIGLQPAFHTAVDSDDMQAITGFQQTRQQLLFLQAKYNAFELGHGIATCQLAQAAAYRAGRTVGQGPRLLAK